MTQNKENTFDNPPAKEKTNAAPTKSSHSNGMDAPTTTKKPGRLKGEVTLTLHTAYAQKLFLGFRSDKRSTNLLQFGGRMGEIWDAAERDDPYADWYLLKIYDQSTQLQKSLTEEIGKYQSTLNQANQLAHWKINPFESEQPVTELLWFRTQYGYIAASLVAHFDQLMRTVLTSHRVGVLLDLPEKTIRQTWLDQLLTLFRLPFKWRSLRVTRGDVKAQNALAKTAQEAMGNIPEPILSSTLRSPFAPPIKPPTIEKDIPATVDTT